MPFTTVRWSRHRPSFLPPFAGRTSSIYSQGWSVISPRLTMLVPPVDALRVWGTQAQHPVTHPSSWSHIGEPGDPGGSVDPVVGPVYGDERLAEIVQSGFAGGSEVLFGHHDPYRTPIHVDHLAVADLVLQPTEG